VLAANVGGFLNRRSDALLMGLFFGPVTVGIYRLADRFVDVLLELTMRPVGAVSLPHFSRLQSDRPRLRSSVRTCMRITLLATVPAMLVLAATSDQLLAVIGPAWEPGGDALKLLAVVGIAKGIVFFTGPLLFALARPVVRAVMLWALAAASAATVVAVAIPLDHSSVTDQLLGMSGSRVLLFLLIVVPVNIVIVTRLTGIRVQEMLPWLPGPCASGGAAFLAVAGLESTGALNGLHAVPALLVTAAVAIVAAAVVLLALEPAVRREARSAVHALTRHGRVAGASPP
jgi:O-antigen/teichoic acid export membrane protein